MHYGVKGQEWGKRQYQNYDGSYTPEGLRRLHERYNEKRKLLDEKHTQASKDLSAKRAVNNLAETMTKLQGEVAGAMFRSGLLDYFHKNPSGTGTAIIRVGDDYIFGHQDELEKQLANLAEAGKSLKDIEILYKNAYNTAEVSVDEHGRVTGNTDHIDALIAAAKEKRKGVTK